MQTRWKKALDGRKKAKEKKGRGKEEEKCIVFMTSEEIEREKREYAGMRQRERVYYSKLFFCKERTHLYKRQIMQIITLLCSVPRRTGENGIEEERTSSNI